MTEQDEQSKIDRGFSHDYVNEALRQFKTPSGPSIKKIFMDLFVAGIAHARSHPIKQVSDHTINGMDIVSLVRSKIHPELRDMVSRGWCLEKMMQIINEHFLPAIQEREKNSRDVSEAEDE